MHSEDSLRIQPSADHSHELIDPGDEIAARLYLFEVRLFHGLVVARALLPAATLLVLVAAEAHGEISFGAMAVWAGLVLWTVSTTPFLWSRLEWARALPPLARLEIVAFVVFLFCGFGTRPWHLLHSFVPLVFVSFLVTTRAAAILAGAIVAALWAVYGIFAVWPSVPLEPRLGALVPTIIVVGTALLLGFVRRLLDDVAHILDARRSIADALATSRALLALHDATSNVYRQVGIRLARTASRVAAAKAELEGELARSPTAVRLLECVDAILHSVDELTGADVARDGEPEEARSRSLLDELELAVQASEPLGQTIVLDAEPARAMSVGHYEAGPLRRLLKEAVVNARKHGTGRIVVRVAAGLTRRIEISNGSRSGIADRDGGIGLPAMRGDASAIGAQLRYAYRAGTAHLTVTLPKEPVDVPATDAGADMRRALERRRSAYAGTVLGLRLLAALVTALTIQLESEKHRSLLPALTAASAALIVWSAILLIAHHRRSLRFRLGDPLVAADAGCVVFLILFLGGMASPWFAFSIGTLMLVGLARGPRSLAAFALLFSLSMLGGYVLIRALALNDLGTTQQDMPFGWILNVFIYAATVGVAASVRWAFSRLGDAVASYQDLAERQMMLEREAAAREARNSTRRELHASLQQYVHAAFVSLGTIEPPTFGTAALGALDVSLAEMRDSLAEIFVELRAQGRTAAADLAPT